MIIKTYLNTEDVATSQNQNYNVFIQPQCIHNKGPTITHTYSRILLIIESYMTSHMYVESNCCVWLHSIHANLVAVGIALCSIVSLLHRVKPLKLIATYMQADHAGRHYIGTVQR